MVADPTIESRVAVIESVLIDHAKNQSRIEGASLAGMARIEGKVDRIEQDLVSRPTAEMAQRMANVKMALGVTATGFVSAIVFIATSLS